MAAKSLNEQAEDLRTMLRPVALLLVAIALAVGVGFAMVRHVEASAPYIRETLSLAGDAARGEAIFKLNCALCHGVEAMGEVGPTLVKVSGHHTKVSLIKQVTSGQTPPMPQFQPDPQAMADLLKYLETL